MTKVNVGSSRLLLAIILLLLLTPTNAAQARSQSWLRGVWEGTGYQTDSDSTWPMTFSIRRRRGQRAYSANYASLKCGGEWRLLTINKRRATFREVLTYGQTECLENGRVIIQRLNNTQLLYLYSNQGSRKITASAILNKRMPARN